MRYRIYNKTTDIKKPSLDIKDNNIKIINLKKNVFRLFYKNEEILTSTLSDCLDYVKLNFNKKEEL